MSEADEPTRAIPPVTDPTQAVPAGVAGAGPASQQWVVDPGVADPDQGAGGGGGTGGDGGYGGGPPTTGSRRSGRRLWASW